MAEIVYGGNKPSYGVLEIQDGWIELRVYHTNQGVRQVLRRCGNNPRELLGRKWAGSIKAKHWMGEVIKDYRSCFEQNHVRIILEADAASSPTRLRNGPDTTTREKAVCHTTMSEGSCSILEYNDQGLWEWALANPVPLFRTSKDDSLIAIFDKRGFFFSEEAERVYKEIKSKPHIYAARFASEDVIYIGKSNQTGGRWKRSHYYHLGCLAYEILGTTYPKDQKHDHWVRSWFKIETVTKTQTESRHHIPMRQIVVISFCVPEPPATSSQLREAERRLIALARRKGLTVLNIND